MTSAIEQHEFEARVFLAERWKFADMHPEYPASTETVIKLLTAIEYQVGLESIQYFITTGILIPPPRSAGRRTWFATDIASLLILLERRRAWLPFSRLHDAKKSRTQIHREMADAGEAPAVFEGLEKLEVYQLVLAMVEAEDRHVRELLLTAIDIKSQKQLESIKDDQSRQHASKN